MRRAFTTNRDSRGRKALLGGALACLLASAALGLGEARAAEEITVGFLYVGPKDDAVGGFLAGVPAPLAIGTVELEDGIELKGFLCEAHAVSSGRDITRLGGWRAYLASRKGPS